MPASPPSTTRVSSGAAAARALAERLTPGAPQPALTDAIAACDAPPEAKAGMFLINGDWTRAHETAQALDSPTAAYWHALVHRHEPDYSNSKYWLHRVGMSPVFDQLIEAARTEGRLDRVAPKGIWDAARFTDCYARPEDRDWTRRVEALELRALLDLSFRM